MTYVLTDGVAADESERLLLLQELKAGQTRKRGLDISKALLHLVELGFKAFFHVGQLVIFSLLFFKLALHDLQLFFLLVEIVLESLKLAFELIFVRFGCCQSRFVLPELPC